MMRIRPTKMSGTPLKAMATTTMATVRRKITATAAAATTTGRSIAPPLRPSVLSSSSSAASLLMSPRIDIARTMLPDLHSISSLSLLLNQNRCFSVADNSHKSNNNNNNSTTQIRPSKNSSYHHAVKRNQKQTTKPFEDLRNETDNLIQSVTATTNNTILPTNKNSGDDTENQTKKVMQNSYDVLNDWLELTRTHPERKQEAVREARRLFDALYQSNFMRMTLGYNIMLKIHGSEGGRVGATSAQKVLFQMLQDCQVYVSKYHNNHHQKGFSPPTVPPPPPPPPEPDNVSLNAVVQAWAKSGEMDACERIEDIFSLILEWKKTCYSIRKQQQEDVSGDISFHYHGCFPDEKIVVAPAFEAIFHIKDGSYRALAILTKLVHASKEMESELGDDRFRFKLSFNTLMKLWARSGRGSEATKKVLELFIMMEQWNVQRNQVSYGIVLDALARGGDDMNGGGGSQPRSNAAERAEKILRQMIAAYEKGGGSSADTKPNAIHFNTCITAWSRCRSRPDAPERAENLYNMLVEWYETTRDPDFHPTVVSGNALLSAWCGGAALRRLDSMERAKQVLTNMERFNQPNIDTYNTLLNAYGQRGMGTQAYGLLVWLLKESKSESKAHLQPDIVSFNTVLNALAKDKRTESAEEAQSLLERMEASASSLKGVQPSPVSYGAVVDAWSQKVPILHAEAAQNAETILDRLIDLYQRQHKEQQNQSNNNNKYSNTVTTFPIDQSPFSSCTIAWSRCTQDKNAPEKAENVLMKLNELYEETGNKNLKPHPFTYNPVITAWARAVRHPHSMARATKVMRWVEQQSYTNSSGSSAGMIVAYNSLMDGFAKRGMAKEALNILTFLKEESKKGDGHLHPNTISYNCALNALANSNSNNQQQQEAAVARNNPYESAAAQADQLLEEMKVNGRQKKELKPNGISYSYTFLAHARHPSGFDRAHSLLQEMLDARIRPNMKLLMRFLDLTEQQVSSTTSTTSTGSIRSNDQQSNKKQAAAVDTVFRAFAALSTEGGPVGGLRGGSSTIDQKGYLAYIWKINQTVKHPQDKTRLLQQVYDHCAKKRMLSEEIVFTITSTSPGVVVEPFGRHPVHHNHSKQNVKTTA